MKKNKEDQQLEKFLKQESELEKKFLRKELDQEEGFSMGKALRRVDKEAGDFLQSDVLQGLAKAVDVVATPVTEGARHVVRGTRSILPGDVEYQMPAPDTTAPYEGWKPSKVIGLGPLMHDISNAMGVQQKPLIEDLGAFEVYAPNTSAMIKHLSNPAEFGGAVLEFGMANPSSFISKSKMLKPSAPNLVNTLRSADKGVIENTARLITDPLGSAVDIGSDAAKTIREIPQYLRDAGFSRTGDAVGDFAEWAGTPVTAPYRWAEGKLRDRNMARNYIESTAENKQLLADLKKSNPQAIEDMVDMVLANKDMLDPFNRGKFLDAVEGPVIRDEEGLLTRDYSQGSMSRYVDAQNDVIQRLHEKNTNANFLQLEEVASSAKEKLATMGLTDSQLSAASKLIDETVGVNVADPAHLSRIDRQQALQARAEDISKKSTMELNRVQKGKREAVEALRMALDEMPDELPNPAYREDLQWLSGLDFVDQASLPPWRNEHVTQVTKENGPLIPDTNNTVTTVDYIPRDPTDLPFLLTDNERLRSIALGKHKQPRTIINEQKIAGLQKLDAMESQLATELANFDRRALQNYEGYQAYQDLLNQYEEVQRLKNLPENLTSDTRQSYNQRIYDLNKAESVPTANEIRKRGNTLVREGQAYGVNPLDSAPRTNAGKALERQGSEILERMEGFEPGTLLRDEYEMANRAIHARKNFQEMNPLARTDAGLSGAYIPQGRMDTAPVAKGLTFMDSTIAPILNTQGQKLGQWGERANKTLQRVMAPQISMMNYKISRDSSLAYQDREQVYSLLMREMGQDIADDFQKVSQDPDAIRVFLRNIEAIRPDLMEKDRYGRIDGVIMDPEVKKVALKDIMVDSELPAYDRAMKLQDLMLNGKA